MSSKQVISKSLSIIEKYVDIQDITITEFALQSNFLSVKVEYHGSESIGSVLSFLPRDSLYSFTKDILTRKNSSGEFMFELFDQYNNTNSIKPLTVLASLINAGSRLVPLYGMERYSQNTLFEMLNHYLNLARNVLIIGYGGFLEYIVRYNLENQKKRAFKIYVSELFPEDSLIIKKDKSENIVCSPSKYYTLLHANDPRVLRILRTADILIITGSAVTSNTIDDILSQTNAKLVLIYGPTTFLLWKAYYTLLSHKSTLVLSPLVYTNVRKAWDLILEFPNLAFEGLLEHFNVASRIMLIRH